MKPRYVFLSMLALFLLGGSLYFLGRLYVDNRTLQDKLSNVDQEVKQQQRDIVSLRALLEALQSDPKTVERIAREHLRMSRDNETVYTFSNPNPQPRTNEYGEAAQPAVPEKKEP